MTKKKKKYIIRILKNKSNFRSSEKEIKGTLEELKGYFSYTLDCGKSYESEKGNYKINTEPKTIKSLVSNLNKASHNKSRSYQSESYELVA